MKELSIEEKAEAYDEAIKVARSKIKNNKDHVLYEEDITDIFPILKENEDERIIKELISLFKDGIKGINHRYTGEDCERWIAWFEKQDSINETTNMWKPSKEQLNTLEFFIPYVTESSVVLQKSKDTLLSLLADLKKLREK